MHTFSSSGVHFKTCLQSYNNSWVIRVGKIYNLNFIMHQAQLYSTANALQRRDAAAALARYRKHMTWSEECEVLDVGCGSGDVTSKLLIPALRRWRRLVAVDVSPAMVSFAAERHQHQNLHFRCFDIAHNTRPRAIFPRGFHKIFSFYCLHWVGDQRRALGNMFELLIPGGELLLVFLASNPLFTVYEKLAEDSAWSTYMQDAREFVSPYQHSARPENELRAHLESSGFTVQDCECHEQTFMFPSAQALKAAIKAVNPFLERIPSAHHDSYLNDCVAGVQQMGVINNDGSMTAQYRLLVSFARKPNAKDQN